MGERPRDAFLNCVQSAIVRVGHYISDGSCVNPPTTVGLRKLESLPFRVVSKYPQCVVWFCHKAHVSQTDRIMTPKTALALLRRAVKWLQFGHFQQDQPSN